jgi:hypothetical protein
MLEYGKYIDQGVDGYKQGGIRPYSFKSLNVSRKMIESIGRWKKIRGVTISEWAIAKGIKKKGIAPTYFFTTTTRRRRKQLEANIEKLIDKGLGL